MKDFVNRIYSKLNPVIINWVDYYASLGQIDEYESNRYKCIKGFNSPVNTYRVGIDLVNRYKISINILNYTYKVIVVSVLAPATERVHQDNGSVDVYPSKVVKEKLEFTEGKFDIDNIDWVTDIQRLMNEYVLKDKAEVEVIENYG